MLNVNAPTYPDRSVHMWLCFSQVQKGSYTHADRQPLYKAHVVDEGPHVVCAQHDEGEAAREQHGGHGGEAFRVDHSHEFGEMALASSDKEQSETG